jgi:aspartyl-tRNA synthetase
MWLAVEENQVRSPIAKFLTEEEVDAITAAFSAGEPGDLILMVAGKYDLVCDVLGRLRLALGKRSGPDR